jgi:hypothetical protein
MVFHDLAHLSDPVFGVVCFKKQTITSRIDLWVAIRFGQSGYAGKAAVPGDGRPRNPKGVAACTTDTLAPGGKGVFYSGANLIGIGFFMVAHVLFNELSQTNSNKTGHRHAFQKILIISTGQSSWSEVSRFNFLHAFGTTVFYRQVFGDSA